MHQEDETWAQTLITVTPEDDAVLREISDATSVSANAEIPLNISTEDIVRRQPLSYRHLISPTELDVETSKDAENQTYLQGIPIVGISTEYEEKAVQTLYMSAPCPPLRYYKDIMTSMRDGPMPRLRQTAEMQTVISIDPNKSQHAGVEILSSDVRLKEIQSYRPDEETEDPEMEVIEILSYILRRALWILDPTSLASVLPKEKEVQTSVRFNCILGRMIIDSDTQTDLSCEPKHSNTKLLSDYQEMKDISRSIVDECLYRGIDACTVVDSIVNEVLDNCVAKIRFPLKNQDTQTLTSYETRGIKEEDLLRKLRLRVVVDPFEASIIIVALMDDLLRLVCHCVSEDATPVVNYILCLLLKKSAIIGFKILEIREQAQPKPLDQVFIERKKKIMELMAKKETRTTSTQTVMAGVPDVNKIKEPKEILCEICKRPSECTRCIADDSVEAPPPEETKILRTQDILLSYRPCYVVTTVSEDAKIPDDPRSARPQKKQVAKLFVPPRKTQTCTSSQSSDTVHDIIVKPQKILKRRDSASGWSHVISTEFTYNKDSASTLSAVGTKSSENTTRLHGPSSSTAKALQVFKDAFCTQKTHDVPRPPAKPRKFIREEDEIICTFCASKVHALSSENCEVVQRSKNKRYSDHNNQESCKCQENDYNVGLKIVPVKLRSNT